MNRVAWWLAFAVLGLPRQHYWPGCGFQDERVHARATEYPLVVLANDVYLRKGIQRPTHLRLDGAARLPQGVEGPASCLAAAAGVRFNYPAE